MWLFGSIICVVALSRVRGIETIECNVDTTDVRDKVNFYLYTQGTRNAPEQIVLADSTSLVNSLFNAGLETRFVIHDYQEDASSDINQVFIAGYLDIGYYNIIVVDWGAIAKNYPYSTVRNFVDDVGLVVALFLEFIEEFGSALPPKIGLLGFGLGAHIAGFAGKYEGSNIATIVGMDPSLKLFNVADKRCRLADTDTEYLLVIHSAVISNGIASAIGHADFYINYGYTSHDVSYKVMADSLYNDHVYLGKKCINDLEIVLLRQCTVNGPPARMGRDPINTTTMGVYEVDVNTATI